MFVWTAWVDCDLPGNDVENMPADPISKVKEHCEANGYLGFTVNRGRAWMKKTLRPVTQSDLRFIGLNTGTSFFSFGPPLEWSWSRFDHYDLPDRPPAAVMSSQMSLESLIQVASARGYAGMSVKGGRVYMQAADYPFRKSDLRFLGDKAESVVFLPRAGRDAPGHYMDYYRHGLKHRGGCAGDGSDCRVQRCCGNPDSFCIEKNYGWASCMSECPGGDWSCRVLGSADIPGLSLLCFAVVEEQDVWRLQRQIEAGQGIAKCQEFHVFTPRPVHISGAVWSTALEGFAMGEGGSPQQGRPGLKTVAAAWRQLLDHYLYRVHSWVVKVDPFTVFFPNQLKVELRRHANAFEALDTGKGVFLKTCNSTGDFRMTVSLQVLSQRAMQTLNYKWSRCPVKDDSAEEGWLTSCLGINSVGGISVPDLLIDGQCEQGLSIDAKRCDFRHVGYHPIDSEKDLSGCLKQAENSRSR